MVFFLFFIWIVVNLKLTRYKSTWFKLLQPLSWYLICAYFFLGWSLTLQGGRMTTLNERNEHVLTHSSLLVLLTCAPNYYVQKWKGLYQAFRNQTLVFRTWIIRQGNTVRVRKLTEIVISLWLEIIKLDKEWFNVILLYGTMLETNIWNKWKWESDLKITMTSTTATDTTDKYR